MKFLLKSVVLGVMFVSSASFAETIDCDKKVVCMQLGLGSSHAFCSALSMDPGDVCAIHCNVMAETGVDLTKFATPLDTGNLRFPKGGLGSNGRLTQNITAAELNKIAFEFALEDAQPHGEAWITVDVNSEYYGRAVVHCEVGSSGRPIYPN